MERNGVNVNRQSRGRGPKKLNRLREGRGDADDRKRNESGPIRDGADHIDRGDVVKGPIRSTDGGHIAGDQEVNDRLLRLPLFLTVQRVIGRMTTGTEREALSERNDGENGQNHGVLNDDDH